MDIGTLPLSASLVTHFRDRGIETLYPPQATTVEAGVCAGTNVMAAIPTASGKTFIAQLAMLTAEGPGLYIVPLRALASEKYETFSELPGVDVGISTGDYDASAAELAEHDIVVATSEKVDSAIRTGAAWVERFGCVVVDEIHLLGERNRGPTLEVTLAKLRRVNPGIQTVALSATVGNADVVADWLDAELVESEWRPIDLRTGVHFGNAIDFDDGSKQEVRVERGEDQTARLVADARDTEAGGQGGSSLVFVNSRRNAESAARTLASVTGSRLTSEERDRLRELAAEIRDASDADTATDLADAVERGAAFHHAGLAAANRSQIEDAFRDRLIKAVAATPTLAAGVNTPARRVVVRDWRRYDGEFGGMKPLDVLEVHQMCGRAGRPGLDPYGEAVLLANNSDTKQELFERYIWAEPEPVRSKLAAEPALRTHVLATVASGFASTRGGLLEFLDNTLYATQTDDAGRLETVTDAVLRYLEANDFLERDRTGETETLTATGIGHTVSRLYLDPMSAAELIDGLREACATDTQSAYEPTAPAGDGASGFHTYSRSDAGTGVGEDEAGGGGEEANDDGETDGDETDNSNITPLGLYQLVSRTPDTYELYLKSGDKETYTEVCYEREDELLGDAPSEYEDVRFEDWLAALKTARLLEDWAMEVDEDRITERYGVGPGDIRGKVETTEWLLRAAETLASDVEGIDGDAVLAVRRARKRVEYGVREQLLDLAGVRTVGRKRARRLYEAGIETRTDLRTAEKSVILGALRGRKRTAERILEHAGREDPSMDGVDADRTASAAATAGSTESDGQASLGDFE